MASPTTLRRSRLHKVVLAALLLVLSACSPADQGRVIRDVALDTEGVLVEIDSGENYSSDMAQVDENDLTHVGQATEACLDDGTCMRIVNGRRIDESTDQWETSNTVWQIEPNATWWNHQFGNGFYDPVVGLFDIVVLPDQTVAVASGQLPIIERSADGEWTPTVADLRTLPNPAILIPAIAVMLLLGALAAGRHHGSRLARLACLLLIPGFLLMTALVLHAFGTNSVLIILIALVLLALAPLAPVAIGLSIESLRRAALEPGLPRHIGAVFVLVAGSAIAISAGVYLLWSDDHVSWLVANALWVATMAAAVAALTTLSKRTTHVPSATPPAIDKPMSLPLVVGVGYALGVAVTIATAVVLTALSPGSVGAALVVLALWLGLGGWVCSVFAAKVPYETTHTPRPVEQLT